MHNYERFLALLLLFSLPLLMGGCGAVVQTGNSATLSASEAEFLNDGVYEDKVYAQHIRTVQLQYDGQPLYSAVVPMLQELPLFLSFDALELNKQEDAYTRYNFQLIHCNADWRKSRLYDMDYLFEYNEYPVTNENFSYNTKIAFTQFRFQVPRVKVPGNYAIKVYRGNDKNDVVFVKRLMIFEPQIGIAAEISRSAEVSTREKRHQIDFTLDYGNISIANPLNDVYVVIRQNHQWFNAIQGLRPTFVQEQDKRLEYRHFNLENSFFAGNEYRYFDIRTVNSFGQNIGEIIQEKVPAEAYLLPDRSRSNQAYSQYEDQNGAFFVGNAETSGGEMNADYISTHFFLDSERMTDGEIYVIGAFNNRVLEEENRMQYDPALQGYTAELLLKQGFYNYMYYIRPDTKENPYRIEGSFFQTSNQYDILVYVRPLGARADLLVGYTTLFSGEQALLNR